MPERPRRETRRWTPGPVIEITRTRLYEFAREPGVIFWVFVFPVLLAIALGIAFRDRAPEAAGVAEPAGRYIDFLIPGLIGLNLMGSSMWGVGFAIVQNRVRKLLKRFAASPMRRSDYLLGMILSRLSFLVLELGVLVGAGMVLFGVEVRGSWLALLLVSLVGAISFTGLALLVAARVTTSEAASGWMNFVMLPMWVLSGSFFSYSRFPEALQPLIRALPLTALNDALRAVMNEGAPIASTWVELAVLAAWGAGGFLLALKIFRWQ